MLITILAWGYNFVSVKLLYAEMTPPVLALVRYFALLVFLWGTCLVLKVNTKVEKGDWPRILWSGALAMGIYMVLFLSGMSLTNPAEGAILISTTPLWAYLFSLVRRLEPFSLVGIIGTLIAFIGVVCVVTGGGIDGHGTVLGNSIVFIAALVWTAATFTMRPLLTKYEPLPLLTLSLPGAAPILLVYGLIPTLNYDFSKLSPSGWGNLVQISVLSGGVAFVCFYHGIQKIGPAKATRYQFFVPPLAALFSMWVLKKPILPLQWLGILLVLGGVALTSFAREAVARDASTART